jgi:hypothetical protein
MSEIGILDHFGFRDDWEIYCDKCGRVDTISVKSMSEHDLEAIGNRTVMQYWIDELALLNDLSELLKLHPTSNHPYKLMLTGDNRGNDELSFWDRCFILFKPADRNFERDLSAILCNYKRRRSGYFQLHARRSAAHASISDWQSRVTDNSNACSTCCSGRMLVEPSKYFGY